MKTKAIITITVLCALCAGCKKYECDELSWTDYNSVEDVHCNFKYFEEENKVHIGDTLKVFGWLWLPNEWPDNYLYLSDRYQLSKILTSDKDMQNNNNAATMYAARHWVSLDFNKYQIDPLIEILEDSLLYVTGVVNYYYECGAGHYYLQTTEIKTTPDYEK